MLIATAVFLKVKYATFWVVYKGFRCVFLEGDVPFKKLHKKNKKYKKFLKNLLTFLSEWVIIKKQGEILVFEMKKINKEYKYIGKGFHGC